MKTIAQVSGKFDLSQDSVKRMNENILRYEQTLSYTGNDSSEIQEQFAAAATAPSVIKLKGG